MRSSLIAVLIISAVSINAQNDPYTELFYNSLMDIVQHDSVSWSEDTGQAFQLVAFQKFNRFQNGKIDTSAFFYNNQLEYSLQGTQSGNTTEVLLYEDFNQLHEPINRYTIYSDSIGRDTLMMEDEMISGQWQTQTNYHISYLNASSQVSKIEFIASFGGSTIPVGEINYTYDAGLLDSLVFTTFNSIDLVIHTDYNNRGVLGSLRIMRDSSGTGNFHLTQKLELYYNPSGEVERVVEFERNSSTGQLIAISEYHFGETSFGSIGLEGLTLNRPRLYPNPATSEVHIDGLQKEIAYQIIGLDGSLKKEGKTRSSISIEGLSPNTYLLKLQDGLRWSVQKLVVH